MKKRFNCLIFLFLGGIAFGQNSSRGNKLIVNFQNRIVERFNQLGLKTCTFETEKHRIDYFDGGRGPVLVLLHGFGGNGSVTWRKQVKPLSKQFRLIVPDLCWFNESYSQSAPTLEAQQEAISDLLKSLDIQEYALAGISYGGFVSLALANQEPQKVTKLLIIDSPGHTFDTNELSKLANKVKADRVEDIFVPTSPDKLKRLFKLASYAPVMIPKGILRQIYDVYFSKNHEQQRELLRTLAKTTLLDSVGKVALDCAIIWGEKDEVFPLSEGKKLAEALHAKFAIIKRAGHIVNLEKSNRFNKILIELLE
jgi:pimeloyl-ACP methyl ester carboxylesterase